MPIIRVEYDPAKVTAEQIRQLATDVVEFTKEATGISRVYAWVNASQIRIDIDPVDIFIELSAHRIPEGDAGKLSKAIATKIKAWKSAHDFTEPINLRVKPMQWQLELSI